MTTTVVPPRRRAPRSEAPEPTVVGRLPLIEARMLAWLACQAAAARQVTVRQLAELQGPAGRPIGVKEALQIAGDLMDTGLVVVPGLRGAGLDQQLPVYTAGYRRPETKVVEKRSEPHRVSGGEFRDEHGDNALYGPTAAITKAGSDASATASSPRASRAQSSPPTIRTTPVGRRRGYTMTKHDAKVFSDAFAALDSQ
ncbi:hypothetical protein ACWCXH_24105 [Kitasatospora sp. NPDC001660]